MKFKYALLIAVGLACFTQNAFAQQQLSQDQLQIITEKANQGNPDAQEALGMVYQSGKYGIPQDYFAAKEWYEKAIQQNKVDSMNNLANMYKNGDGIPQDYTKAIELYKKADSLGNNNAAYNIALMYDSGKGVTKNMAKAKEWYEVAIKKGNGAAFNNLGAMYQFGDGVPKNLTQAKEYFKQACLHKSALGCKNYKELNTP